MNVTSIAAMVDKLEQANRAITMIEEMRERLVKVLGHTCTCEHEEHHGGD